MGVFGSLPLPGSVAFACLRRTAAINAAMTARGMQQLGLIYVLAPALRYLYPEPEARARAFRRYEEHSNTHAFMLPAYAGLLISQECHVAAGRLPEAAIAQMRQVVATTLSALGDGFFSGALRTLWAMVTICLILQHWVAAAAVFTGSLLALLLIFRATAFYYALTHGLSSLMVLRKIDLATWTERIKVVNALVIGCTMWLMLVDGMQDWPWMGQVGVFLFIPLASWLVGRLHMPREVLWTFALGVIILIEGGHIRF